jgi:hypothetical protein
MKSSSIVIIEFEDDMFCQAPKLFLYSLAFLEWRKKRLHGELLQPLFRKTHLPKIMVIP